MSTISDVLDSEAVTLDMESRITSWFGLSTHASYGREQHALDQKLRRLSVSSGVNLRF